MPNVIRFEHGPSGFVRALGGALGALAGTADGLVEARRYKDARELATRADERAQEAHEADLETQALGDQVVRQRLRWGDALATADLERSYAGMRQTDRRLDLAERELNIDEAARKGGADLASLLGLVEDPDITAALGTMQPREQAAFLETAVANRAAAAQDRAFQRVAGRLASATAQSDAQGQPVAAPEGGPQPLFSEQEAAERLAKLRAGKLTPAELEGEIATRTREAAEESTRQIRHQYLEEWGLEQIQRVAPDPLDDNHDRAMQLLQQWTQRRGDPDADPKVFRDQLLMALYPDTFHRAYQMATKELGLQEAMHVTGPQPHQGMPFEVTPHRAPATLEPPPAGSAAAGAEAPWQHPGAAPTGLMGARGQELDQVELGRLQSYVAGKVVDENLTADQAAQLLEQVLGRPFTPQEAEAFLLGEYPGDYTPEEKRARRGRAERDDRARQRQPDRLRAPFEQGLRQS